MYFSVGKLTTRERDTIEKDENINTSSSDTLNILRYETNILGICALTRTQQSVIKLRNYR